jgi:hypothetical protein
MDATSVSIVFATILGPVLAVQAQKYLERHRDQKRAKDAIFRTLMATRASRLSADHVQALNGIELAFYHRRKFLWDRRKEKKVLEAWKAYHDHLNDKSYHPARIPEWTTRQIDLFIDLLHEMAVCLGYDFDKTQIKNSWYSPQAHGTVEEELNLIRSSLAEVLTGKRSLPVAGYAATEDEAKQVAEIRTLLIDWLKAKRPIPVTIADEVKAAKVG